MNPFAAVGDYPVPLQSEWRMHIHVLYQSRSFSGLLMNWMLNWM